MAALALLLTGFVMAPTLNEVNRTALKPWMDGTDRRRRRCLSVGAKPFRAFMLRQTRHQDIETFVRIEPQPAPPTIDDVPLVTLTSAFVISELRTAFQIGFALFLPFIVIDVAVSSVLMSMGMFMLPPAMISLPFKLLLFVLVDGWSLIVQSLVTSFRLMSHALVVDLARNAIMLALLIAGPMLLVALLVGLTVSVLQAVTQIQEQTLAFVPKLVGVSAVFLLALPWMHPTAREVHDGAVSQSAVDGLVSDLEVSRRSRPRSPRIAFAAPPASLADRLSCFDLFAPGSPRDPRAAAQRAWRGWC